MIIANGTTVVRPCLAQSGHQLLVLARNTNSACTTPRAKAPTSAAPSDSNRPTSATASAGTTRTVRLPGVITPVAGPATIIANDANTVATTHVSIPSADGDSRANDAAR